MNEKNCYVILSPSTSNDRRGWTAKLFDPVRQEWTWVANWHPTQEGALQEAESTLQELLHENQIAEAFKVIMDDFKQKGFSLQEILNGFAELADRENYPHDVGYFLEQASVSAAAECNPQNDD